MRLTLARLLMALSYEPHLLKHGRSRITPCGNLDMKTPQNAVVYDPDAAMALFNRGLRRVVKISKEELQGRIADYDAVRATRPLRGRKPKIAPKS